MRKQGRSNLVMALILLVVGVMLANPFAAKAESSLVYLYPIPPNNPIDPAGRFYWEQHPEYGGFTLTEWATVAKTKTLVIAVPEGQTLSAAMAGDKLGKWIAYKLGFGKNKKEKTPATGRPPKDKFIYSRNITREGITEKVEVEIAEHFSDPAIFQRYVEIISGNLTDTNEIQNIPQKGIFSDTKTPQAAPTITILGNTFMLGGLALLIRILVMAGIAL